MNTNLTTLAERVAEVEAENARLRDEVAALSKALGDGGALSTAYQLDREIYGDLIAVIERVDREEKLNLREKLPPEQRETLAALIPPRQDEETDVK